MISSAAGGRNAAGENSRGARRWVVLGVLLIVVVVGLVMLFGAHRELSRAFIMDEMEYPSVAQAIKDTGRPVYYRGESLPHMPGLWHPPLYILWLAGWLSAFGSSVESSRAFGLFTNWLALFLIALFVLRRSLFPSNPAEIVPKLLALGIGLGLAGTSPLLIQGSVLPDIDTQVLPLVFTAGLLLLFEARRVWGNRAYLLLFVLTTVVVLFAKLTAAIIWIPTFVAFEFVRELSGRRAEDSVSPGLLLSNKEGQRNAPSTLPTAPVWLRAPVTSLMVIAATGLGLALMVAIWFVGATVWGVSFAMPFEYMTQSTNNPANFASGAGVLQTMVADAPSHFRYVEQWVGYPALAFLALMIVREFAHPQPGLLRREERWAVYAFLLTLIALYIVLRPAPFHFPKYYPPLIPFVALLAIDFLLALVPTGRLWAAVLAVAVLVVAYGMYVGTNSQTAGKDFIYEVYWAWPKTPVLWAWMLLPLVATGALAVCLRLLTRQPLVTLALIGSLGVALGWQFHVTYHQSHADYSTTYYYGENSLVDVAAYLGDTLPADAIVLAPKDLGFLLQDRWRYVELPTDPLPVLDYPGVQYLAYRTNDQYGNTFRQSPGITVAIASRYEPIRSVGNFVVLRRR